MEVAEIEGNQEAIEMLKEKFAELKAKTVSNRQPGFDRLKFRQPGLDAAIHSLSSMSNQLSDEKQVEQHMKTGAIPCGIWHSFSHRLYSMQTEIQQLIEDIQHQIDHENMAENLPKDNPEKREKLKSLFNQEKQIAECCSSVETLKQCEKQCVQSFYLKFGEKEVGGAVEWDDVGLFMNLIGLSQHVEQIQQLGCTPYRAMKLISEDSEALDLSIGDKLKLKFANYFIKTGEKLPFEHHFAKCNICRQPPHVFLKEYFPAGCENKKDLETYQLIMVSSRKESEEVFGTQDPEPMLRAKAVFELHSKMNSK